MYYEAIKKRKVKSLKASKASLIYFRPIYDFLLNQYADNEIFLGIEDSKEFFIYNENTYDLFFYDFAIPKEKIIIEFNGKAWHPNWEKYDTNTLEENFKFNTIKDISYYVNRDKHKIDVARQKGFDVLILWEEDSVEENWNKVKRFLNDKKINYEN
jgi:very-short-patch-repair endonuclease